VRAVARGNLQNEFVVKRETPNPRVVNYDIEILAAHVTRTQAHVAKLEIVNAQGEDEQIGLRVSAELKRALIQIAKKEGVSRKSAKSCYDTGFVCTTKKVRRDSNVSFPANRTTDLNRPDSSDDVCSTVTTI